MSLFLCEKHYHLHFTNCKPNGANQLCLEWKFGLCSMSEPARIKCPILVILDFIYRYHHTSCLVIQRYVVCYECFQSSKIGPTRLSQMAYGGITMIKQKCSLPSNYRAEQVCFPKNSDYFTLELTFILSSLAARWKKTIRNELYVIYFDND